MHLPLFPLNTVLFPGALLPLHIFEERYRRMVGACLEGGRPFGALLIRAGNEVGGPVEPFEIGTTAHILRVQHLGEGRMNLVCAGGQRFRLMELVQKEPYLMGKVQLLEQVVETDGESRELAETAGGLFTDYMRLYLAVTNQWVRSIEIPSGPGVLADFIGSRLRVSLWTKQRILEELSARKRLQAEVDILADALREMRIGVATARAVRWRGFAVMN